GRRMSFPENWRACELECVGPPRSHGWTAWARLFPFALREDRRGSSAQPRRLKTADMPSLLNLRQHDLLLLTGHAPHSRLTCTRSEDIRRRKTHPATFDLLTVACAAPSVGILIFGKG